MPKGVGRPNTKKIRSKIEQGDTGWGQYLDKQRDVNRQLDESEAKSIARKAKFLEPKKVKR